MAFPQSGLYFLLFVLFGNVGPKVLPDPDVSSEWPNALDQREEDNMPFFSETPVQKYNDDIRQSPVAADFSGPACGGNITDPECTGIVTPDHLWPKIGNRTVIPYDITTDFSKRECESTYTTVFKTCRQFICKYNIAVCGDRFIGSDCTDAEERKPIEVALERIEHQTGNCITFAKMKPNSGPLEDHIKFERNEQEKCHTFIGRRETTNEISLDIICLQGDNAKNAVGTVMHEVLHRLGFFHEHSRPDRSDFVKIHRGNIDSNERRNFVKFSNMDTYELHYDMASIMHYGAFSGAPRNGDRRRNKETITPRSQYENATIGQRLRLSDGDMKKILLVYGCCARDDLDDCVDAIKANKTGQKDIPPFKPGTTFPILEMNATEWGRQQIANKCRFPVNPAYTLNASMPMAITINCNTNVTLSDLKSLVKGISQGPARPVAVFLRDNKDYMKKSSFALIAKNVVIFILSDCGGKRATGFIRALDFVNVFKFQLSNCADLSITKEDFHGDGTKFRLEFLRMITFANTTIRSLEANAFEGLPRLVTVSLEYGASSMRAMCPSYASYLLRLHCSCGFSGFRRWMNSENMVKVHSKSVGEIFNIPHSWINSYVPTRRLHLNYDCAQRAIVALPGGHYENLERFSLNDAKCIPDSSP